MKRIKHGVSIGENKQVANETKGICSFQVSQSDGEY